MEVLNDNRAARRVSASAGSAKASCGQTGPSASTIDDCLAVSIDRLAEITSLGRTKIYAEVKAGRLKLRKLGKRSVVLVDDAKAWLRGEQQAA